jgi:hypothetical protein
MQNERGNLSSPGYPDTAGSGAYFLGWGINDVGGSGNTAGLAANYSLAAGSASGTITGRALTVTSPVVTSKAYDGTTVATITGTLSGVLNSDTVTLVGTGTFASKNVGANQVVTSTSTLSGAAAGNYALTQPSGLTGTITAKALSTEAPTIASKVYDGTTVAGAVTVGALSGTVSPETLTVSGTADAYSSAAVGTYQNVVVTYTLTDNDELRLDYEATTDLPTVLNLTNHTYWNLGPAPDILAHELTLHASRFTAVDAASIPTGDLPSKQAITQNESIPPHVYGAPIHGALIHGDLALALALNAGLSTIRTWRAKRLIPFIKTGHKSISYNLPKVLAALESLTVHPRGVGKGGK